jgi:protein-L-isoaspartate(D-aspartate) O-methyltransferase
MHHLERHRQAMLTVLRQRGIKDEAVLAAMSEVPRHAFVPSAIAHNAYADKALPIGHGQTISQPYVVALMTEKLHLHSGQRVLEIGTGSGYQAAILAHMGLRVFTIERHKPLWQEASRRLPALGFKRIVSRCGDGTAGWPALAPFDAIIVTAAGPQLPQALLKQLNNPGRMIIPVGQRQHQELLCLSRSEDGELQQEMIAPVSFVPLIGEEGWRDDN